ncbi:MAG: ATP-binding cassette domain-containing protein, partial [Desulfovibrio sp.]|nr:ATP-binding cassette domain-containing protein [Desulfovibrio sp.]
MGRCLVVCDDVSLFLPGDIARTLILKHISFSIEEGQHIVLTGANGSGKSTLLRLLAGELWPCSGRIAWLGEEGMEESLLTGRSITSLVSPAKQLNYQKHAWSSSGLDLILTGLDGTPLLYTAKKREQVEKARILAASLACDHLLYRDSSQLSQGQLRILLLCRALIREPALLLLDECLEGLDKAHVERMQGILEKIAQKTTICFVTHTDYVPSFCQNDWFMEEGRLVIGQERKKVPQPKDKSIVFSHGIMPEKERKPTTETSSPLFLLENATVFIEGSEVLHSINWRVERGEHWFVGGENGSGKSTLLRLLNGDECCACGGKIERFVDDETEIATLMELRKTISLVSSFGEVQYDYPVSALELVCSGFENSVGLYREYSADEEALARDLCWRFFDDCSKKQR